MMTLECEASIFCVCNDLINLFPKRFCANNDVYLWGVPFLAYLLLFIKFVLYSRKTITLYFFPILFELSKRSGFLMGIKSIKKEITYFSIG